MKQYVPKPTRITRAERAAHLRSNPGVWQRLTIHRSDYAAKGAAHIIRTADRAPAYEPAGAFEAMTKHYGDSTAVYARWLGPDHEAVLRRKADIADPTLHGGIA